MTKPEWCDQATWEAALSAVPPRRKYPDIVEIVARAILDTKREEKACQH